MRCVILAAALGVVVVAAGMTGAASWAQDRPASRPGAWRPGDEVLPGEIVIRRTGTKRVAARPAVEKAPVVFERVAELPYEGPGPRTVTIGYMVRDEIETGWGPQVHCPAPAYGPGYGYSACDSYSYNSYLPAYGSGYGPGYGSPCGPSFAPSFGSFGSRPYFGTPSYCEPVARPRVVRMR